MGRADFCLTKIPFLFVKKHKQKSFPVYDEILRWKICKVPGKAFLTQNNLLLLSAKMTHKMF